MSFISILIALLLEQVYPLRRHHPLRVGVTEFIFGVRARFDAGTPNQAALVWATTTMMPAMVVVVVQWALGSLVGWWAVVVWNILVLHLTLGFRQFSFHLTGIRKALEEQDEQKARELLGLWRHLDTKDFSRGQIYQQVMEASMISSHRSVFGVFFWYAVLASMGFGPAGAVLYRCAELTHRICAREQAEVPGNSQALRLLSQKLWWYIDWLPVRMSVISFAMVGNFEEVVDNWRSMYRRAWAPISTVNDTLLVSCAFAAVGLRAVASQIMQREGVTAAGSNTSNQPDSGQNQAPLAMPEINQLVGLVWRALLLWLLLLALLSAANLLG